MGWHHRRAAEGALGEPGTYTGMSSRAKGEESKEPEHWDSLGVSRHEHPEASRHTQKPPWTPRTCGWLPIEMRDPPKALEQKDKPEGWEFSL